MRSSTPIIPVALLALLSGCGTTRSSDTRRTATEQLLVSTAVDRAINDIDLAWLAGKDVYFDAQYLDVGHAQLPSGGGEANYVASELRQHILAAGAVLKDRREDATYVVEARAGAIGTDRHEVIIGFPSGRVPLAGVDTPEMALAKATSQRGIAKIALFAYNRRTGQAVWQSGMFPQQSTGRDTWFAGIGPFQRGTIYDGTKFAGSNLVLSKSPPPVETVRPAAPVAAEALFGEAAVARMAEQQREPRRAAEAPVAGHQEVSSPRVR
jgi:hypothetical protein